MSSETLLSLALLLPIIGALAVAILNKQKILSEIVLVLVTLALLAVIAALVPLVMAGSRPSLYLFEFIPGLSFAFEIEPLGMLFALVASFLWVITTIYTLGYLTPNKTPQQLRFHICFCLALSCTIGIAFAGNILTLFFFYEALTLVTYPLVTHSGTEAARRGGRNYLGILLSTSVLLFLLAIAWTYIEVGSLDFRDGGILKGKVAEPIISILLVLYLFGIGKSAIMPFHGWLPSAMVAPAPVSALLHAVAVVKAGVFTVLKIIIYIFGIDTIREFTNSDWLLYVSGATILIASVIALRQDNLKRRLAYSTVSQLSYIILGAGLANAYSIMGGAMHIAMHGFAKITLFFCAGAIFTVTQKTEISQLNGIGRKMPVTMVAFTIGAIALIGLPPFGGAWSKYYLVLGTLDRGSYVLLAVLLASSLLNVFYFLPIIIRAFYPTNSIKSFPKNTITEAPVLQLIAISITALGCIGLFIYPQFVFNLLRSLVGL